MRCEQELQSMSSDQQPLPRVADDDDEALRTRLKVRRRNGKVQSATVALMAATLLLLCVCLAPVLIDAQLAWSPIQVDSESK